MCDVAFMDFYQVSGSLHQDQPIVNNGDLRFYLPHRAGPQEPDLCDVSHEGRGGTRRAMPHGTAASDMERLWINDSAVHDSVMPDMAKSFRAAPALAAEKITPDSKSVQPRDFPTTPGKRFPPTCLCPPGGIKRPALA